MINLLLTPDRTRVRREYLVRVLTVGLFLFAVAVVLGFALLIPSFVLSQTQLESATAHRDLLSQSIEAREGSMAVETVNTMKVALGLLADHDAQREARVHILVADVVAALPSGVAITRISFDRQGTDSPGRLSISGTAKTRTALLSFVDALEEVDGFGSVDLPVSNLASERDITYTLTVSRAL